MATKPLIKQVCQQVLSLFGKVNILDISKSRIGFRIKTVEGREVEVCNSLIDEQSHRLEHIIVLIGEERETFQSLVTTQKGDTPSSRLGLVNRAQTQSSKTDRQIADANRSVR